MQQIHQISNHQDLSPGADARHATHPSFCAENHEAVIELTTKVLDLHPQNEKVRKYFHLVTARPVHDMQW